jgi:3-isopropylmalate/(R)-2-methylmalate dehydratase small subunit
MTMTGFVTLTATAAPLMRSNIDTDIIIRIDRMVGNSIRGTLGQWCFGAWRYLPDGSEDPAFIFNREPYRHAGILIAGPNFGCGSSREPAVWALQEMGIRAIVGSGFGDIFYNNCFQNGVLPIVLDEPVVEAIARSVVETRGSGKVTVDLKNNVVIDPAGGRHPFSIENRRRIALMEGLDEIGMTLRHESRIAGFQQRDRALRPWIYIPGVSV